MKVVICSTPGSEVFLLSNFLKELGVKDSNYYCIDNECFGFESSGLSNSLSSLNCKIDEVIGQINDNEFIVGHFGVDKKENFEKFKNIFLYRDIKYSLVTFGLLADKLKIAKKDFINCPDEDKIKQNFILNFLQSNLDVLFDLYKKNVSWIHEEEILKINFDKLNGNFGREIQIVEFKKILEYLNFNLTNTEIEVKISNALNKDNLFKIYIEDDYNPYFTKNFINLYKNKGFKKLNKILGYDRIHDIIRNKISFTNNLSFYDRYWKVNKKKVTTWCYGINIVENLISNYKFKSVLDAGCGSGDVVRYLLSKGYNAKGIELSSSVLKDFASDLLKGGIVQQGSLMNLPFKDNEFDVVFSTEVLEHINEKDIPKVIQELSRVCKGTVFLTISLRPSSNFNKYHINLKPRSWWEDQFLQNSFVKDYEMIEKLQKVIPNSTVKEIMEIGPTRTHIHEMEWFINNPPYDLNGELEPWYFIFKKNE